jgi:hypothetical protein
LLTKEFDLPKGFGKPVKSKVYRFRDMWDLVIVPNDDMSVTFVFWDGVDGAWSSRFDDMSIPVYQERFG